VKIGKLALAYRVYRHSLQKPETSSVQGSTKMMESFSYKGWIDIAQQIYEEFKAIGITPDLLFYNSALNMHCKTNNRKKMKEVLDDMKRNNIRRNYYTYNILLDSCMESGRPEDYTKILEEMERAHVKPNHYTYRTLALGYLKHNMLEKAKEMYIRYPDLPEGVRKRLEMGLFGSSMGPNK